MTSVNPAAGLGAEAPALCLPPRAAIRAPATRLPARATDCHCHVYEDAARWPLVAERSYTPAEAPLDAYLAMCETVGIERTVQVSASVYGHDNALTESVIQRLGQHRARGVAGLAPGTPAAEIERLHAAGFRGVRLSTHVKGYGGTDAAAAIAAILRPLGWHVQLHVLRVQEIADLESELLALPTPIVFDHMGGVRGTESPQAPGFQALLRLLQARDDCWVKISSWYRRSARADYADMRVFAQALVAARPDRVVFGSNWPHPNLFAAADVPDDGTLVDTFAAWVPQADVRQRILVDNPAALYGFPA